MGPSMGSNDAVLDPKQLAGLAGSPGWSFDLKPPPFGLIVMRRSAVQF